MLRTMRTAAAAVLALTLLGGCLAPSGASPDEKRAAIQKMKDDTLVHLYQERPSARDVIAKSAGYAVFSNVSALVLFVGGGGGYGVAVEQPDGRQTYMKTAQVGVGVGLGVQDIRVVFVFHSRRALDNFVINGMEFGAQMDVTAKSSEKGGAVTGEISIDPETSVYTLSEAGLMAKVNLAGTRYWKDILLN